jgi:autotransporter-associated beta strand protein
MNFNAISRRLFLRCGMGGVRFFLHCPVVVLVIAFFSFCADAGNPLWNGAGSVTNNNFSNTNNWVTGDVPSGNNINNLPVGFGPLASGATNTANCDATGNSQPWTFNAGTASMIVTINGQQLGAATGPDVFINNSTNLQTISGTFSLFDIGGTTTSRRFNAAAGPLAIATSLINIRGDSSPATWAIEFAGTASGTFNSAFNNVNDSGTLNYLMSGSGTWEIVSALPNLTTNASALTVSAGTLTLDAANTYSGPSFIAGGATLNVVTTAAGAGAFTVSNNATLGVTLVGMGTSLTNSTLNLGLTGSVATTLNLNLTTFTNPANPLVLVKGALNLNGSCIINVTNGMLVAGQFPLIKYGSQTGTGNFALGALPPGVVASLSNNLANSSVDLVVTANLGYNNTIFWDGGINGIWDLTNTANWKLGAATGLLYSDTNQVIFDDSASGNFAVTLNSAVKPLSVTVSNSINNFSITGSGGIGGNTALNKSGTGVLTLGTLNSYSGQTVVNSGALVLNNLGAVPAGSSLNIANGAVVQPNQAGTYTNVPATLNGSSTANGSFGGSLDFHSGGSTTVIWPGAINLNSPTATIGSYGVTYNVTLSGQLTGGGSLTFRPEGGSATSHTATYTLTNPTNNFAGSTTMQVGNAQLSATLKLGVNNGLPTTTTLNLNRVGSSGVVYFDLAGYSQILSGLTANFTSNAVINSSGSAGTLAVSNNAADNFYGDLGVAGKANFSFKKLGAGTLTIGGPNIYTGTTTIGAGTLMVTGLVTATSGLVLSNNATLQVSLGGIGNATNIWVNGNVTLSGQINLNDSGIVSNTVYPVIYYSGTLNTNGLTVAPLSPWAFTIDTSVPHLVRLIPTQKFPLAQFTNGNFVVTSLTTNLGGILRGLPAGPIWYEVRDQTNKMWDFGAAAAVSPWSITVRHLRAGTNTVTVFSQDGAGYIQSNSVQLTLTLGPNTGVRPRPIPSEIWWGGISDNTGMTNYSLWPFVQKFQDGYFFHSAYWSAGTAWLQQSLAQNLTSFNTKFWPELGGDMTVVNTNSGNSQATTWGNWAAGCEANGIIWSEFTHDYHMENMQVVCQVNPTWATNDQVAWWTGDLSVADGNYPYGTGIWRDAFNGYYARFPHVKVGHTSQPEYWPWDSYPAEVVNQLAFTVTNPTTAFSFNAHDIIGSFVNMASSIGHPYFALQSDSPWDYFGAWGSPSAAATMRQKIRIYEQYLQSRNCRHTLICNVSNASTNNQGSITAADNYYETSSLSSMYLHQREGGRANRYLYESWYWGVPYVVVPETQAGSYTHLAMSAIKYLKGIADTNGNPEPLNITPTATNGTVTQLQLQNNGDVQCLPALAGQAGTVPGVTTRYFTTNGAEITATILTAEGLCYTNMLQPGAQTNLFAVTLAGNLSAATNDNAALEAFWNPQDPLGIVRDREFFAAPLSPLGLWQDADIGSVGVVGGSALSGTNFTLLGSGADVWGTADAFHFVYQTNSGDVTITARVSSQVAANAWSKAGVMVRENISAGARNAFVCVTPNNGVNFQNRAATGGASFTTGVSGLVTPYWVRLTRSGTTFTALCSSNGVNWVTVGSSNLTGFATSAVWGLAATAHDNTLASAVTFDNVALPNVAPVLNPISNRTLVAGQTLTLTNTATDANVPAQILTFSLVSGPAGMTLNPTNGILSWRPTIAQSPTTNTVTVQVADNGTPSLSAMQSFTVTVLSPAAPALTVPMVGGGIFSLLVNGSSGPDYILWGATNLNPPVNWLPLKTNLSASPPFTFTDPATNTVRKFYRVQVGP